MPKKTNGKITIIDKVTRVSVNKLKPNPWNPNKMTALEKRSLEHGIRTEGFIDPLHVQQGTNIIIDGEHRWKTARKLGMKQVPVIYLDVDDAQARKLTLAFLYRRGSAKDMDVALLLKDVQELESTSLKQLELDTSIARKNLKELMESVEIETPDSAGLKKKGKKKSSGKKKKGKVDASPAEPDEGEFTETQVGDDELAEMHQYPVTFFAPTIEGRELIKAMFTGKSGDLSFVKLMKVVDYFLKKHPKRAKKVAAAVAAE